MDATGGCRVTEMLNVRDDIVMTLKPWNSAEPQNVPVLTLRVNRFDDPLSEETFAALTEFVGNRGCTHPVIVGHYNVVIDGEARLRAWRAGGHMTAQVIQVNVFVTYKIPRWKRLWRKLTWQNELKNIS